MASPSAQQNNGLPNNFFLFLPGIPLEFLRNGINPMDFMGWELASNLAKSYQNLLHEQADCNLIID